jgi:phage/plasmid-associated DNA primase
MQPTRELIESGLPAHVHDKLGYRIVTADEAQKLVGCRLSGWVVPMLDPDGKHYEHDGKPFYRLKPDPGQMKGDDPPRYLSIAGGGCRPYFSPLMPKGALALGKKTRITEGEKKNDCLNHHGFASVGVSGVDAFTDERVGKGELIPELAAVNWSGREVLLAYDSDVTVKDSVRGAIRRITDALTAQGAAVSVVLLPCELNGDKNGVDDFIGRHGANAYAALERIARPAFVWKNKETRTWWSPEPTEPHHKALTAWTVFKEDYADRPSIGLYRWVGTHWRLQSGNSRDAIKRPLHQWMDHMNWHRRGDSVVGSMVSEVLSRLQHDEWDPAGVIAFTNGTLRGGVFTAGHRREDHITFCFPFPYDAGAKCSEWHKFLRATLGADDLIRLLRAAFRWSITPKDSSQPFPHELVFDVHGPRRAGKGTLSEVLQAICGGKAGVGLLKSASFSNPNALHGLIGKRVAIDPDASGHVSDPGVFNNVASNEPVAVKKLYKDTDDMRLGVVIWRFFNDTPGASGGGMEGMGRRIVTFRFERSVVNPDESLKAKLIAEAAGIFWWAWSMSEDDMHDALRNRGQVAAIREASIEGALERDHVMRFSTVANAGTHRASDLYRKYRDWMVEEGHQPVSMTKFGREMKKLPWVKPTTTKLGTHHQLTTPTHHQLATHIGIEISADAGGEFNPPPEQTHHPNPPPPNPLGQEASQDLVVSVVGSLSKKREREEEEEIRVKAYRGSEVGSKPTTPTTAVPVYVDGVNGWTSPTGRISKGDRVLLTDPKGQSRLVERKRVSLTPPRPPEPEPDEYI